MVQKVKESKEEDDPMGKNSDGETESYYDSEYETDEEETAVA